VRTHLAVFSLVRHLSPAPEIQVVYPSL
jgi:hypothetical protein